MSNARIEAVAKALCIESGDDPSKPSYAFEMKCTGSDREPKQKWEYWIPFAQAAIAAYEDVIPVQGAESAIGAHVAGRTGGANPPTGAEPCPYAIDGCVLESQEVGPCLCANPIDRASVALTYFGEIDSIACTYACCDNASLYADMRHIHELASLARDIFDTSPAVAETRRTDGGECPPPGIFSDPLNPKARER